MTSFLAHISKQEIELSFNSITHIGIQRFCDVMNDGYSSMTRLLLDNNKLGDKGAKCLAGSLLKLNLVELNIGFNGIEPEGLIEIINAIYTNPTIETLTLSGNNITNTVSKVIANMLLHNYNLRQLFLDHTNIGPVGEKYISAGIATNRRSGVRIFTGFQLGKVLVITPHYCCFIGDDKFYIIVGWTERLMLLCLCTYIYIIYIYIHT